MQQVQVARLHGTTTDDALLSTPHDFLPRAAPVSAHSSISMPVLQSGDPFPKAGRLRCVQPHRATYPPMRQPLLLPGTTKGRSVAAVAVRAHGGRTAARRPGGVAHGNDIRCGSRPTCAQPAWVCMQAGSPAGTGRLRAASGRGAAFCTRPGGLYGKARATRPSPHACARSTSHAGCWGGGEGWCLQSKCPNSFPACLVPRSAGPHCSTAHPAIRRGEGLGVHLGAGSPRNAAWLKATPTGQRPRPPRMV